MIFDYQGRAYSRVEGKTVDQLREELMAVFQAHPEYSDPEYGGGDFQKMVEKFAKDDFYKLHFVAKQYLRYNRIFID